jgi:hypothetical protein
LQTLQKSHRPQRERKAKINQFHKSYRKNNTGKHKREGYPGCIALTYYDVKIANELKAIYNVFTKINTGT